MIAHNQDELEKLLSDLTEEVAKANDQELIQFWGVYESGQAAQKTVELIMNYMRDKKGEERS